MIDNNDFLFAAAGGNGNNQSPGIGYNNGKAGQDPVSSSRSSSGSVSAGRQSGGQGAPGWNIDNEIHGYGGNGGSSGRSVISVDIWKNSHNKSASSGTPGLPGVGVISRLTLG